MKGHKLKPEFAANLSLILVGFGWLLLIYGVLSQLGDPAPYVPQSELQFQRHLSMAVFLAGVFLLGSALWLSGFSFTFAKKRAIVSMLALAIPFAIILFKSLWARSRN